MEGDEKDMAERLKKQMDAYDAEYDADKEVEILKKENRNLKRKIKSIVSQSFMANGNCSLCDRGMAFKMMGEQKTEWNATCKSCLLSSDPKDFPLPECPICKKNSLKIKRTIKNEDAGKYINASVDNVYVGCDSCGGSSPKVGWGRNFQHTVISYHWNLMGMPFSKEGYIDFKAVEEAIKDDEKLREKIKLEKKENR